MTDRETKRERMQIRKDIGNRAVERPEAQPKGPDYLIPMACFACRKSWKRDDRNEHSCPECGSPLAWMGRNFSAPKQTNTSQWKKVELLWLAGFRFVGATYNHHGGVPLPDKLREVEAFLRAYPDHPMRLAEPRSSP